MKWSLTMLSVKRERQWEVGWSDAGPDPTPTWGAGLASCRFFGGASSVWLYMITEGSINAPADYTQKPLTYFHHPKRNTIVWSSLEIKEISGGLGTMYVVRWATKWTFRGSCHGWTPEWWTNIIAYKVPLLRVFLGRDTLIALDE